jgi:hypothetical protein
LIPQYVQKLLIAASSTGLGTLSTAAVATINSSVLDTQRRITAWTTGATSTSATITIIGTREGGTPVRETITGPTSNAAVATTQDFLSITSVSASSVLGSVITFGTNTSGGTQWKPINTHTTPIQVGCYLTLSSTSIIASMEITMDDPTTAFYAGSGGSGPSVAGGLVAAGGQAIPYNVPPAVINCVGFSSVQANTFGALGITSSATAAPGFQVPFWGWRLTLTSSSSTAGNVNAAVIQAGVG